MTITAITHTDVRGNVLNYLKVVNKHKEEYLINVGIKTYNEVNRLIAEEGKTSDEIKKIIEDAKTNK